MLVFSKVDRFRFIQYNGNLEIHNSLLNVVLHDDPSLKRLDRTDRRPRTSSL